jgi:selenide,water dikinase
VAGVHAATDVTGFGLLGHLAEICAASDVGAVVDESAIPVFAGARALVGAGIKTGASGRNWESIESRVDAPAGWNSASRDILTDPQTNGGLLVACAPDAVNEVLGVFMRRGHANAAVVGRVEGEEPRIRIG